MTEATALPPLFRRIEAIAGHLDDGYAILTPNRRLSRAVRDADQQRRRARGDRAWSATLVMPLAQFWSEQWRRAVTGGQLAPARLLGSDEQRLLWEQVIEEDTQAGFSLLNSARAAALCQQADEQLLLWRIDPASPRWSSWFAAGQDSDSFLRWREAFVSRLAALGALTPERAQGALLAGLSRGDVSSAALPPLLHLHCDELTPLHAGLARLAPASVTVDAGAKEYEKHGSRGETERSLRAFYDTEDELRAAAAWCREQADRNPGGRYAVVLQDMDGQRALFETMLREAFDCLTSDYERLPVNFATGFALARAGIVRDALRILALGGSEVDVEAVSGLLLSRFVGISAGPARAVERALRRLRELGRERLPTDVVRDCLSPLFTDGSGASPFDAPLLLQSRGVPLSGRRFASEWLEAFDAMLCAWAWGEGAPLDSLEYQQHEAWCEALDAFVRLDDILGRIGYEQALAQLHRLLDARPFQPQTPDRSLQVLGPLETTGLVFDGLWLTGMDAGTWPARARPNPYLPLALQKSCSMPRADAMIEASNAARRWSQWCASADRIHASYVWQRDDAEQLPSPLLANLVALREVKQRVVDSRWHIAAASDTVGEEAMPPLQQNEDDAALTSATLEAQAQCPFQAFARFRLEAQPRPQAVNGISASERGSMLHRALYELYGRFPGREALRAASESMITGALDEVLESAQGVLLAPRRRVLGAAVLELEKQRLRILLRQWLALEAERPQAFIVEAREDERHLLVAGLRLRLRLDRVDRLEDGSLLVIDYKGGRPEGISTWLQDPPSRPQLPIYALAEERAAGISYALLRPGALGWSGIAEASCLDGVAAAERYVDEARRSPADSGASQGERGAFDTLREFWRDAVAQLAEAYATGACSVTPLQGACRYCARHALCRIGELQADDEDGDGDGDGDGARGRGRGRDES
ncbi:MAG: PD-(D/E)XK nuclease family protein [Halieaceae bacterium]|jgi:probable DNA repair protein|nr:PD-(D/E)XK nuclease family protein [Halieaceae bacterium]